LLFLSKGGVLVPEPRLFVRKAAPFCFFAERKQTVLTSNTGRYKQRYGEGLSSNVSRETDVGYVRLPTS